MNEIFTFDGVQSSAYGVYIAGDNVYNAPERSVEMVAVPGRNGDVAIDGGRYNNIEVTYPAFCWDDNQTDFADKISELRNELTSRIGYKRLTDSYHPDEYRLAIYRSGLDVSPAVYNRAGQFDIIFDCKPQRFLVSGETAQVFTANGSITNPTKFRSRPLLVVTGIGTVGIGDYSFTLEGVSGQTIYVDCEIMDAYEYSGSAIIGRNDLVQYTGNSFPVLEPGANGIVLGSGITRIEITPRWYKL